MILAFKKQNQTELTLTFPFNFWVNILSEKPQEYLLQSATLKSSSYILPDSIPLYFIDCAASYCSLQLNELNLVSNA